MNSKTRSRLRSLAATERPVLQIGKNGAGETLVRQADEALTARELIKISVLETAPAPADELARRLAESTGADVVQIVGRKITLYRKNPAGTGIGH